MQYRSLLLCVVYQIPVGARRVLCAWLPFGAACAARVSPTAGFSASPQCTLTFLLTGCSVDYRLLLIPRVRCDEPLRLSAHVRTV